MKTLRFDDYTALRDFCEEDFGPWGDSVEVTQAMIDEFAELTSDRQWIHVDVARAQKESPFGGTIAHGFLILSLLPAMNPLCVQITGHHSAANYGASGLRFYMPVPAGSRIHAHSRLIGVEPHKKGSLLTFAMAIHIVDSERPALVYEAQLLYMS